MAEHDGTGAIQPAYCVCVHADHNVLPTSGVARANGTTNMRRQLKTKHGIVIENDLQLGSVAARTASRGGNGQPTIRVYLGGNSSSYPTGQPTQQTVYSAQLDMVISK